MRYFLDTHTFIWWSATPAKLSAQAYTILSNPASTFLLSTASIWEMQIKIQTGKLIFPSALPQIIAEYQRQGISPFPVELVHIYNLANLPLHHRDPFDRMLISQSLIENIPIITRDPVFARYPVQIVW